MIDMQLVLLEINNPDKGYYETTIDVSEVRLWEEFSRRHSLQLIKTTGNKHAPDSRRLLLYRGSEWQVEEVDQLSINYISKATSLAKDGYECKAGDVSSIGSSYYFRRKSHVAIN